MATFLESFDVRTAYPLLLFLLEAKLADHEWKEITATLESYLLRRSVLGWSTKAYNRIFLNVAKSLHKAAPTPENLRSVLSGLSGESSAWPSDEDFFSAWQTRPVYHDLNNAKLVHVLRRLNDTYLTSKNEKIVIDCPLTVEHILPQDWIEHWPLPGGEAGLDWDELYDAKPDEARAIATHRRNAALQTVGNLTVLTLELNSAASNSAWLVKKPQLLQGSLLPLNSRLHEYDTWDEDAIAARGKELFERAVRVWPAPVT